MLKHRGSGDGGRKIGSSGSDDGGRNRGGGGGGGGGNIGNGAGRQQRWQRWGQARRQTETEAAAGADNNQTESC